MDAPKASRAQLVTLWHRSEVSLRVRKALECIERAQNQLADAQALLSSIRGASPAWKSAGVLHTKVQAFWFSLERRNKACWIIDREPEEKLISLLEGVLEAEASAKPEVR
jgi:hypothetical protein